MKKFKRFAASALAVFVLSASLAGCAVTKTTSLATVDGETVTADDFYQYFPSVQSSMLSEAGINTSDSDAIANFWKSTEIEGKNALTVAKERALNEAVNAVVQTKTAEKMGITLTEDDKKQISDYKTSTIQQSYGSKSNFVSHLKEMNTTEAAYDKALTASLISSKLYSEVSKGDEYKIDEKKAEEELKNGEKITAKHILFSTVDSQTGQSYDDAKKSEVKKNAEDTLEKIKSGADFDALMQELSEDPGLAQNPDGYTFGKGEMVAPFEEAAFALKEGEVSGIVESNFGYHIIKRVPLTISQSDIDSKIKEMQSKVFEEQIDKWKADMEVSIDEKALAKIKAN